MKVKYQGNNYSMNLAKVTTKKQKENFKNGGQKNRSTSYKKKKIQQRM
jgi:hypothetical protein